MRSTMSTMRALRKFIPYVMAAIALSGSQSSAQQNGNSVPTEFVRVDGLHFAAGNERFYFLGTNNYYLHQFVSVFDSMPVWIKNDQFDTIV